MKQITLSITLAGDEPPSEFRIFTAGQVDTTKGTFTFDAEAAKSVMADYALQGVDLMIDYAHAAMRASSAIDPAQAGKAAGWFQLELRNGELWATNVRWTQPAAAALQRREWRFMSPTFQTDSDGRIENLLNVALTNMPATLKLQPLMAAAKGTDMADGSSGGMTLDQLLKIAKALGMDPASTPVSDLMAKLAGAPSSDSGDEAQSPPAPAPPDADPAAASSAPSPAPPPEKDPNGAPSSKKMKAASRVAMSITGLEDPGEAIAELARTHKVAVELEAREAQLAKDRTALEAGERRALVGQLVKLGAEIPATAWSDDKGAVPCKRLQAEPIGELRARVTMLGALGTGPRKDVAPPASGNGSSGVHSLSAEELAICTELNCEPQTYVALKTLRDSVKRGS